MGITVFDIHFWMNSALMIYWGLPCLQTGFRKLFLYLVGEKAIIWWYSRNKLVWPILAADLRGTEIKPGAARILSVFAKPFFLIMRFKYMQWCRWYMEAWELGSPREAKTGRSDAYCITLSHMFHIGKYILRNILYGHGSWLAHGDDVMMLVSAQSGQRDVNWSRAWAQLIAGCS